MKLSDITSILNVTSTHSNPELEITTVETDTRKLTPGALFVALKGAHFDGHHFIQEAEAKGASCILASRSYSTRIPLIQVKDTLESLTHLAMQYRQKFNIPVIGLTGSCGKTTTKTLIAQIFKQQAPTLFTQGTLNNHIGVPLTLMGLRPEHQYAVIEMGANHSQEIFHLTRITKPNVALITNIAPVHLEGFGSLEGIYLSKSEIFHDLDTQAIAVINADEPYAEKWRNLLQKNRWIEFGIQNNADISASNLKTNDQGQTNFTLTTPSGSIDIALKLIGSHQVMNALAATACAYTQSIPLEKIKNGLESLSEIDRRLFRQKTIYGGEVIDDSYNANPTSTLAALNVLNKSSHRRIFVFADMLELGSEAQQYHEKIGKTAKEMGIEKLYAYGKLAQFTIQAFGNGGFHFSNKEELIQTLQKDLDEQTTLLVKGSNGMKMWEVVHAITQS